MLGTNSGLRHLTGLGGPRCNVGGVNDDESLREKWISHQDLILSCFFIKLDNSCETVAALVKADVNGQCAGLHGSHELPEVVSKLFKEVEQ